MMKGHLENEVRVEVTRQDGVDERSEVGSKVSEAYERLVIFNLELICRRDKVTNSQGSSGGGDRVGDQLIRELISD